MPKDIRMLKVQGRTSTSKDGVYVIGSGKETDGSHKAGMDYWAKQTDLKARLGAREHGECRAVPSRALGKREGSARTGGVQREGSHPQSTRQPQVSSGGPDYRGLLNPQVSLGASGPSTPPSIKVITGAVCAPEEIHRRSQWR